MTNNREHGLKIRIDIYELLARIFRTEATDELIEDLRDLNLCEYFSNAGLSTVANAASGAIESVIDHQMVDTRKLRIEYAKLFIGPNQPVAPPWGSVYLDSKKTVMGESTLSVRRRYEEFGLAIQEKNVEPDDHIAYELSFVSFLLSKSIIAEDLSEKKRYADSAVVFAGEFLAPWIGDFADSIISADVGEFYKGFALVLSALADAGLLSSVVE